MSNFFAGFNTFFIGILMVFLALLLLIVLIDVSGKLISGMEQRKNPPESITLESMKLHHVANPKPIPEPVVVKEDDCEIVAVITSVIALSLGTTTDKLHVKSLRRIR